VCFSAKLVLKHAPTLQNAVYLSDDGKLNLVTMFSKARVVTLQC
jgi:hypothetical protein